MADLQWEYYMGGWDANSQIQDDGIPLAWAIIVLEDGTFDVNESSSELRNSKVKINTFSAFAEAAKHCQDCENELVSDVAMWARIDAKKGVKANEC